MEEHITPLKTGIKWGGYLAAASMALTLVSHYAGFNNIEAATSSAGIISTVLSYVISFAILFLGIKYFKDRNDGLLTFGEGMSVSLFIGIFSGLIMALFMMFYASYIMPDFAETIANSMDVDEMSAEEAEVAESMMGIFTSPIFLAFSGFLGSILTCLVLGLFASAIQKKE